ncbi:MAG: hypothetical protein ACKPKO_18085, partial [Candidatus Fonsibacter sp.]
VQLDTLILLYHLTTKKGGKNMTMHKANESWNNPMSAGALSRYILWEYPSLTTAINQYAKRFGFKNY